MNTNSFKIRTEVQERDKQAVEEILRSSGFFREDEIMVAVELVEERLNKGVECGYDFVFIDDNGRTVSYACFGLIPCSLISYDLYWIGTHEDYRGKGVGKIVLQKVEEIVKQMNGKALYIETSAKPLYEPTRQFYLSNGCKLEALFEDFYDIGDGKCVFVKRF